MSDGDWQIVVDCRGEGGGRLLIRAREPGGKLVTLDVAVEWSGGGFRASSTFFGYHLEQFVDALTAMHRRLDGAAHLANTCGEVGITFRVADAARGRIVVDGQVAQAGSLGTEGGRRGDGSSAVEFRFAGIETDQSCLPQIARTLSEYVRLSGLSTEHPMKG